MDDDDDYFTPTTTSSRRLAMLFSPEEMPGVGGSSQTSSRSSSATQFKFVAPKQPRSSSASSKGGQPASADTQEVLLEVPLILVVHGTEKNGMLRTRVSCQVVGSVAQRSFSLAVARVEQAKGELWRAAVDTHLALEVVEHSTVKVTAYTSETLTLLGEAQQIEALVTQVTICRGVACSSVTQQDLHTGKGHVLAEGDVAKVSFVTYTITASAHRGEKVEDVKGMKVTVSAPSAGTWESCLAGAAADSHRLIFIPKHKKGEWQPPTEYHDVKIDRVKTKGSRDKATAGARSGTQPQEQQQQQQQSPASHDAPPATNPPTVTETRVEVDDSHDKGIGEEEERASRKAALMTRMAQVGTQIFPQLPSAIAVPQSQVKPQVAERSRSASADKETVSISTPASTTPTPASSNTTPATTFISTTPSITPALIATTNTTIPASTSISPSAPVTVSSTGSIPVDTSSNTTTTTTLGLVAAPVPVIHPHTPCATHDSTVAHTVSQLGTTVTKIADKVELLLAKMERVEAKRQVEAEGGCVPETLMALANGLVTQNERLRTQLEATEKKLVESQAAQTSLLTMNTQLLEEKKEMLRMQAELRKEKEAKEEELKKKVTEQITSQEKKEEKENSQQEEVQPGLTLKEVQSLVKSTLNGLFRQIASEFNEEETHYSQPQVILTLRSGLEVAYSSFVDNLEKMTEEETEQEEEAEEEEQEQGEQEEVGREKTEGGGEDNRRQNKSGENRPSED